MTGWEVERGMRAACRSLSIPVGSSPLMPSPSQGAERRPERRAGHTGSRWALRVLVIGGLAGVAWLLTGTAAHAADHDHEPTGSRYGPAGDSGAPVSGDEPEVGGLLKAAVQPLESEPAPDLPRRVVTSILTTAERMLSAPVGLPDEVMYDGTAIDADPYGEEPFRTAAAARTSAGGAGDQDRPEPAEDAAEPVNDPERYGVTGAELPPVAVPAPAERAVTPATAPEDASHAAGGAVRAALPTSASTSIRASRAQSGLSAARHANARFRSSVHRRVPAARPASSRTVREDVPAGGEHTPARMNLGTVSGIPAGAPGPSGESGPMAVLPARIGNGAVDSRRFPVAADVAARRHAAESPTVSPD